MAGSISILVSFDGNAREIREVIDNLRLQSRAALEIVVATSGREDVHELQALEELRRGGVCVLGQPAEGAIASLRVNQHDVRGDYVVFLEQSCRLHQDCLAQLAAVLDANSTVDFVCSRIESPDFFTAPEFSETPSSMDVLATGEIPHPAMMFRRHVVEKSARVLESTLEDDLDFFVVALERTYKGAFLDSPLVAPLSGQFFLSHKLNSRAGRLDRLRRLYTRHLGESDGAEILRRKERFLAQLRQRGIRLDRLAATLTSDVESLREEIATLTRSLREKGAERVTWGDLRRLTPLSTVWGSERGQPVNRYFIEQFLNLNRYDIQGRVLEVKDSRYADKFGKNVTSVDVLDIDPVNHRATIMADLTIPHSVPAEAFDCFILTQVLNVVADVPTALENAWHALRPGGVLLCTVASVDRVSYDDKGGDGDYWRFTTASLQALLRAVCPVECFEVTSYGNVITCAAHLYGLSAEELSTTELETHDAAFPLLVAARAVKETGHYLKD